LISGTLDEVDRGSSNDGPVIGTEIGYIFPLYGYRPTTRTIFEVSQVSPDLSWPVSTFRARPARCRLFN